MVPNEIVSIYPNPTTGEVFFNGDQIAQIVVTDINGRWLSSYKGSDLKNGMIDLSRLNQSVCILRVVDVKDNTHYRKIIVIR